MNEHWKELENYAGYYAVSDLGRVRSLSRLITYSDGRIRQYPSQLIQPCNNGKGYWVVTLNKNGVRSVKFIHYLVLTTFVSECPPKKEGCHKDGNTDNNRLINLRWGTKSSNIADQVEHGTHNNARKLTCPAQHLLIIPNLVPSALLGNKRECLTCSRTYSNQKYALSVGKDFDWTYVADIHYQKIMRQRDRITA